MRAIGFGMLALCLMGSGEMWGNKVVPVENDTIKTYQMGEVIITSSTKETNAFKSIPGAVSVISPQSIAGRQIHSLKDVGAFIPNFYMPDYGSKLTSAIYIRGIGARSSGQSIGLYIDNMPYLDKSVYDFELTDIQRIEVLRGPQGTLYGRNAMGGIINIYTISPFDFQGKRVSVSAGSYGQYSVKASHYAKLSEKIGFTAAAYYDHKDGFFTNQYTGKRIDPENVYGGRLKLEGRFSPRFTAAYSISADYTDQGAFPYGLYQGETGAVDVAHVDPVNINDPSSYKRLVITNNLSLNYQADLFSVSSTTGYQYFKDDMLMDQDFSPLSIFTLNQKQKQNAISEEISIKSLAGSNYQWSFGLYGFYNALETDGPVDFKADGISTVLQPVFDQLKANNPKMPSLKILNDHLYIPGSFNTPSYGLALYHQSTYNNLFTEGLSVTAGIRLDYEKQKMDYQSEAKMDMGIRFSDSGPYVNLNDIMPMPTTVMDEHVSQDFWELLPKVTLKYECSPTTMTYASVAKGYKTGGYNVQMSADLMQNQMRYDMMKAFESMIPVEIEEPASVEEVTSYKPEKSWSYEVGFRSELIKQRLNFELALFYMDVKDVQITQFVNSGNGRILTNAGKARSYGAEASLRLLLTEGLTADVNYGYTHASFRDYNDGQEDYAGNFIPYTPRHTLSVGAQYVKLFRGAWIDQFNASAQFSGNGKIYWTEKNDIYQNFYGTLNARIGVRKGILSCGLWARNITNTDYAAFYFESFSKPYIQLGKPFQIGAEISVTLP